MATAKNPKIVRLTNNKIILLVCRAETKINKDKMFPIAQIKIVIL